MIKTIVINELEIKLKSNEELVYDEKGTAFIQSRFTYSGKPRKDGKLVIWTEIQNK